MALCSDSKNVIDLFSKVKAGIRDNRYGFEEKQVTIYPYIFIFYINRNWDSEADSLAKQGI